MQTNARRLPCPSPQAIRLFCHCSNKPESNAASNKREQQASIGMREQQAHLCFGLRHPASHLPTWCLRRLVARRMRHGRWCVAPKLPSLSAVVLGVAHPSFFLRVVLLLSFAPHPRRLRQPRVRCGDRVCRTFHRTTLWPHESAVHSTAMHRRGQIHIGFERRLRLKL